MSASSSANDNEGCFDEMHVFACEHNEIATRRNVKNGHPVGRTKAADVKDNLVGLALSGGGVRSGALGLGFLQGLHEVDLLDDVDYLSTVSGGGYAGAYLSSVSLISHHTDGEITSDHQQEPVAANPPADEEPPADGSPPTSEATRRYMRSFPIASEAGGKQPARMLDFIYGGSYLRKTWHFINRYLIGLLLSWVVIGSGMVAVTSLVAWCFRHLDYPWTKSWLNALQFDSDLSRAFFPSFVLLLVWLVAWTVSYFREGSKALGNVARVLSYLMLASLGIAIAALIGAGDITLPGDVANTAASGTNGNRITSGQGFLRAFILSAIGAALLPYLAPSRLLRSGKAPQNTTERYVFWVATRAVAIGLPFVLIAFFARENISGWNEARSAQLTVADITDWSPKAPIWWELLRRPEAQSDSTQFDAVKDRVHFWSPGLSDEELRTAKTSYASQSITGLRQFGVALREQEQAALRQSTPPPPVAIEFSNALPITDTSPAPPAHSPQSTWGYWRQHDVTARPLSDGEIGFLERWWLATLHVAESLLSVDRPNRISQLAELERDRDLDRWTVVTAMNQRLMMPDLYSQLVPIGDSASDAETEKLLRQLFVVTAAWHTNLQSDASGRSSTDDAAFARWKSQLLRAREVAQIAAETSSLVIDDDVSTYREMTAPIATSVRRFEDREAIIAANRDLLAAVYGSVIRPRGDLQGRNVLYRDQKVRLSWFFWALGIFLVSSLIVDLNATSWHGYYSARIGQYWIDRVPGLGRTIPLAQMETTSFGRPYHIITGCLNKFGRTSELDRDRLEPWTFSKLFCGSETTRYAPTKNWMDASYTLQDAVAVSGAAVSPIQKTNPLVSAVLLLFNVRLGQWVDNPSRALNIPEWMRQFINRWPVTPMRAMINFCRPVRQRTIQFLTDGGHCENLGIEQLLRRRCRVIVAVDAGQDQNYDFADLIKLLRRMRIEQGIHIEAQAGFGKPLDVETFRPGEDGYAQERARVFRIHYPETRGRQPSYLIYMKSNMTGDEPLELRQLAKTSDFPHDPTADQFYDSERFEAYRHLGHHMAFQLAARLKPLETSEAATVSQHDFVDLVADLSRRLSLAGDSDQPIVDSDSAAPVDDVLEPSRNRPEQIAEWVQMLSNPAIESMQRMNIARELGDLAAGGEAPDRIIPAQIRAAQESDDLVASGAARALESLGQDATREILNSIPAETQRKSEALTDILHRIQLESDDVNWTLARQLTIAVRDLSDNARWERAGLKLLAVIRLINARSGGDLDSLSTPQRQDRQLVIDELQYVSQHDTRERIRREVDHVLDEMG